MIPRVVNIRNVKNSDPNYLYIGRGSKWGNPFIMKEYSPIERKRVIDAYYTYITQGDGTNLLKNLKELEGKMLACYCAPRPCHGDVLVELYKLHVSNAQ